MPSELLLRGSRPPLFAFVTLPRVTRPLRSRAITAAAGREGAAGRESAAAAAAWASLPLLRRPRRRACASAIRNRGCSTRRYSLNQRSLGREHRARDRKRPRRVLRDSEPEVHQFSGSRALLHCFEGRERLDRPRFVQKAACTCCKTHGSYTEGREGAVRNCRCCVTLGSDSVGRKSARRHVQTPPTGTARSRSARGYLLDPPKHCRAAAPCEGS